MGGQGGVGEGEGVRGGGPAPCVVVGDLARRGGGGW